MNTNDCIFCKIVRGEIPNHTVYEDDYVLAFLDIHPIAKGHTVVVPKIHYETIWQVSLEDFGKIATGLRAAAGRVEARLKPEGMNIGLNNGEVAGQSVPHMHWHIVPRSIGDGGGSIHSVVKNREVVDVAAVSTLFKNSDVTK